MAPANTTRIVELSTIIASQTAKLDAYITSNGLPSPSFDVTSPPQFELSEEATACRDAAIEAMDELQNLLLGPVHSLFRHVVQGHPNLISLGAISRFKIAHSFPVGEERSFEQISNTIGLNEDDTRRVLRHAMTNHIFTEPSKGIITHTAASKALATVPSMNEWFAQCCDDMWPAASRCVDAMVKWPGSQEPNQTGFALANNTEDPFFVEIGKDKERSSRFADAMNFFHQSPALETRHVVDGYDWATLGLDATVVDLGGSHGPLSIALVEKYKGLKCVVQDLPEAIEGVQDRERVRFMVHDFFTPQPIKDADVYYFRMIFHNWSDKYCVKILKNLIPALKIGARVVISDFLVPEPGVLPTTKERDVRCFDLAMKEIFNAKERDIDGWKQLFESTGPGFSFVGVTTPRGSQLSIIEARWEGIIVSNGVKCDNS